MRNKLLETFVLGAAFGLVCCSSADGVPSTSEGSQVGGATNEGSIGGSDSGDKSELGGSNANESVGTNNSNDVGKGGTSNVDAATSRPKPAGGTNSMLPPGGSGGATNGPKTGAAPGVSAAGRPAVGSGRMGNGGAPVFGGLGGSSGKGGGTASSGASSISPTTTPVSGGDVDCNAAMPTGGQQHSGNSRGGTDNLAWEIWSNQGSGTMTTFSTPAFSASWNNSGDYLGRLGYEWGNGSKTFDAYGTITAKFAFKKTGTAGSYSYIGIYGWSTNPCVEWYIIDDSFNTMPFTPWNSSAKGTPAVIDGETYKFYSNSTNGTGGSRCNQSSWSQFWSVRQKGRQCGTITISDHFKAWDAAGMKLGALLEAKILVETGGGSGTVEFPIANVSKAK